MNLIYMTYLSMVLLIAVTTATEITNKLTDRRRRQAFDTARLYGGALYSSYNSEQEYITSSIVNRTRLNRYLWIEGKKFVIPETDWLKSLRNEQISVLFGKLVRKSGVLTYRKYTEIKRWLYRNAFMFVVFNCADPSFYYPIGLSRRGESVVAAMQVPQPSLYLLRRLGTCDQGVNVWKYMVNNQTTFLTVNPETNAFRHSARFETINSLVEKNLCHDFMKLLLHPSYFNRQYPRPSECNRVSGRQRVEKTNTTVASNNESTKTTSQVTSTARATSVVSKKQSSSRDFQTGNASLNRTSGKTKFRK